MNAIAMMFQQIKQPSAGRQSNHTLKQTSNDKSIFHGLLLSEQQNKQALNANELMALLQNSPEISSKLNAILKQSNELEKLLNNVTSNEEALQVLEELVSNLSVVQERNPLQSNALSFVTDSLVKPVTANDKVIQEQVLALFTKVEEALTQITNQQNVPKAAASLLKVLEQWTSLEKRIGSSGFNSLVAPKDSEQAKVQAVWRDLVQAFQKRNQLVANQQYNTNAKVTSKDVAKWVQNAINSHAQLDKTIPQQGISMSTMPMSKLEQYVIYVNQTTSSQPVDQQLIEQFQKVMKTSKFLTLNNGTSQLSIALRPENLGEMMVKLTQINGEMTVKIMVTSQAAKEMLESNMHQLKNMFSPQQVVIEKQDMNTQQSQHFQSEHEEQSWNDDHDQSNHSDDNNKNNQSDEDFETQFQELLMNEKV